MSEETTSGTPRDNFRLYHPYIVRGIRLITDPLLILLAVIFVRVELKGLQHVRSVKGNVIFSANHSSEFDPIAVGLPLFLIKFPIFFIAAPKGRYPFKNPVKQFLYGGRFFRWLGAFSVKKGLRDYEISLKNHLNILENGHSVLVFPQGELTRVLDRSRVHGGVSFLSHRTGRPIIPVTLEGLTGLSLKKILTRNNKVVITYHHPVKFQEESIKQNGTILDKYKAFAVSVMETIYSKM